MGNRISRICRSLRADICALLLIAFLFQLLTPVIVLADSGDGATDFESSLRASICRVDLSSDAPDKQARPTDGFVCDLCLLCHLVSVPVALEASPIAVIARIENEQAFPLVHTTERIEHQLDPHSVSARAPPRV